MAPAAPLNVRSVLHVKTVIWYFSVTAWRSSSECEFEERSQLTPLSMWSDLNDCSYIRMHSRWIDSSFDTEMKSPALPWEERENYNALGCSTKLPMLAAMFASFWKERASFCLKLPKRIVHWNLWTHWCWWHSEHGAEAAAIQLTGGIWAERPPWRALNTL